MTRSNISPFQVSILLLIQSCKPDEEIRLDEVAQFFLSRTSIDEPSFQEFIQTLQEREIDCQSIATLLEIHQQIESVDTFLALFDESKLLLVEQTASEEDAEPQKFEKEGIYGLFIRRLVALVHSLPFEDVCRLFREFREYVEDEIDLENDHAVMESLAHRFLDNLADQLGDPTWIVPEDNETLLRNLETVETSNPELNKLHFVKYLHYTRSSEFELAKENLHRYFDRQFNTDGRDSYQYALLNLAILHANFDNMQESMQVLSEALQVAQENGDEDCIAYCLSWIQRIDGSHSDHLVEHTLPHQKPKDQSHAYLESLNELFLASQGVRQGASPKKVKGHLYRSLMLNDHHKLDSLKSVQLSLNLQLLDKYGEHDELEPLLDEIKSLGISEENATLTDLANVCFVVEFYHRCGEIETVRPLIEKLEMIQKRKSIGAYHATKTLKKIKFLDCYFQAAFEAAKESLEELEYLADVSWSDRFDLMSYRCMLSYRQGLYAEALDSMGEFMEKAEADKSFKRECHTEKILELDILKARILIAENSFAYALSVILDCIPVSEQHYLSAQELRAKVILAHILYKMNMSTSAKEIVQDLIAERIDAKDLEFEAYLYEVLANCCVAEDVSGYEAKGYFRQALEAYRTLGMKPEMDRISTALEQL